MIADEPTVEAPVVPCPAGEHLEREVRDDEPATPCFFCGRLLPESFNAGGGPAGVVATFNDDTGSWWFERSTDPDGDAALRLDSFPGQVPDRLITAHERALSALREASAALAAEMRLHPDEPRRTEPCPEWTGSSGVIQGGTVVYLERPGRRPVRVCSFARWNEAQSWIDALPAAPHLMMDRDVVLVDRSNLRIETTQPATVRTACVRCGWSHDDHSTEEQGS